MSDIDIIMQVEQYPILWDSRLKEFRNKTKQNVAWMMIAEKLNMTGIYSFCPSLELLLYHLLEVE